MLYSRLTLILLAILTNSNLTAAEWPLAAGSVLRTASVAEAREVLGKRDAFIERLSPFDRTLRLQTDADVSDDEFLTYMQEQALEWTDAEEERLAKVVAAIAPRLRKFDLPWPNEVLLVKTTGKAERGASGYCRGNAVVLIAATLDKPARGLEPLLTHELFHVLSNQNPKWRKELYAVVGFKPCNEVAIPASLLARKITNPDAPSTDYYTEIEHEGMPQPVVPVLYSKHAKFDPNRGGTLFDYLLFRLMAIEEHDGRWRPLLRDGEPVLIEAGAAPTYFDRIGKNTAYIIHPEEVLAENFVQVINGRRNAPTPRILDEMRKLLAKPTP